MSEYTWVYDLEQFVNFHSAYFINVVTNEEKFFIIHADRDDRHQYHEFLMTKVRGLIGFNCLNYDSKLINVFLENVYDESLLHLLYQKSCDIIDNIAGFEQPRIPHLDLFTVHHYNNKARRTSLKWIEFYLRMDDIMDLPINPTTPVDKSQFDEIEYYNRNDVIATKKFYEYTKQTGAIDLRHEITTQFGFDALNMSDVGIGARINSIYYSKFSKRSYFDYKEQRTFRPKIKMIDCIPDFVNFETDKLKRVLGDLKSKIIEGTKGQMEYKIEIDGNYYNLKNGGLHSHDSPMKIKPKEDELLCEVDVASMYPFGIINNKLYPKHLGEEWLKGYEFIANDRLKAKAEGDKTKADCFKLALNGGGFGKTNDKYSWMYDPLI